MQNVTGGEAVETHKDVTRLRKHLQGELGLGHEAGWEYFRVMYERYRQVEGKSRTAILDEFCLTTNYNRKYAIRLLNGPPPGQRREKKPRGRKPRYGQQVISILAVVWEAAGYPWSVRLKALLPAWTPWIGKRYRMSAEIEQQSSQRLPAFAENSRFG
jgi:hypothetical protein